LNSKYDFRLSSFIIPWQGHTNAETKDYALRVAENLRLEALALYARCDGVASSDAGLFAELRVLLADSDYVSPSLRRRVVSRASFAAASQR
jgi:hypothetical protein